jgi:hypothetical protein
VLLDAVAAAEKALGGHPRRLFHLAVPPAGFAPTVGLLAGTGLASNARLIVEKPFGTDLASARALNQIIHATFDESQVFRIDHFLGKESVDTSWPCGSPTDCSSRSGTVSTSTTYRSMSRRRSVSRAVPGSSKQPARSGT